MKQKRPTVLEIRTADPLTRQRRLRGARSCNLCIEPSKELRLYRECDEWDRPIVGDAALLFVCTDHPDCLRRVDDHPRLYVEDRGAPGTFPKLCGPCVNRDGYSCRHPNLTANGGPGLKVGLGPFAGLRVIIRTPDGCRTPLAHALDCELPGEAEALRAGGAA